MGKIIYTMNPGDVNKLVDEWRDDNKKIVFTNGCFDLIHQGHIALLFTAKSFGDRLIVGLNTDASIRRLKGESRPVKDQDTRVMVMQAFKPVDAVVLFNEDTPMELIKRIRPDVLVKGGDYQEDQIVGAREVKSWGGEVKIVPLVEGFSSSMLINRIKPEK